jgi:ubiquitin related modifier 1
MTEVQQNLAESSQSNGVGYAGSASSTNNPVLAAASSKKAVRNEDDLEIRIEFGYLTPHPLWSLLTQLRGGLHLLFSSKPRHTVHVPRHIPNIEPPQPTNMRYLIKYLKSDVLSEREEMFGEGDSVWVDLFYDRGWGADWL